MIVDLIQADWPAPGRVRAYATTRAGGLSRGPYQGLNLGDHVGDDPAVVAANRAGLARALDLHTPPCWLRQVHGQGLVDLDRPDSAGAPLTGDASLSRTPGRVCAVLTADCLPVLFCDRAGQRVAAAHAGWRGLAAGVLAATVRALGEPGDLLAWLGPAIGAQAFEVGDEVRATFLARNAAAAAAFRPQRGRWLCDLAGLARLELRTLGVHALYGGELCTYSDPRRFYSYRRDGVTGRQASLIWLAPD